MIGLQRIEVEGKRFVLLEEGEYERLWTCIQAEVRCLLGRDDVRTKPPGLPIEIVPLRKPSTTDPLRFGERDIRVRKVINVIAGTAGASWIAYIPTHAEGKAKVRVQLFSKAVEVCPQAAKVIVELE